MTTTDAHHEIRSLFGDDEGSANERLHYEWLKQFYFPSSEFLIYPNLALQVLVDPGQPEVQPELGERSGPINLPNTPWHPENFLMTSCVDLCVIQKSDYVPLLVIEIDGESHSKPLQRMRDALKNSLLELVGLPLVRLRIQIGQTEQDKQTQLSTALSQFKRQADRLIKRDIFLSAEIAQYFELLSRIFNQDDVLILPNVALISIFPEDHVKRFTFHAERNLCRTGLIDFAVVGKEDFRPIVAFSMAKDDLRQRLFAAFRLPLLQLHPAFMNAKPTNQSQ